ncbi:Aldehyde dehydrogenase family [seawater metagenome]|uniref:Aldehyde dehydrogenase family n=1 Tax=seawater metagenome TaxID=1561972 RepID=A0A5E8CHS5_9ZZZZ
MPKESRYIISYKTMIEPHFINGEKKEPQNTKIITKVKNPTTGQELKSVALEDLTIVNTCIENSLSSFKEWSKFPMHKKTQLLIKWYTWIETNKEKFIKIISEENGKPYNDAKGEYQRGIEVIQYALSLQSVANGQSSHINDNLSINSFKEPIGIVLAICPFNFPFMIPLWFIPISLVLGNVIIVKPSEKVPGCVSLLAEGASKVGIPNGVFNVVQGGHKIVEKLIEDENIKAVSFVGSTFIGKKIYDLATKYRKRIQCNMGAKNHVVITKSADIDTTVNGIVSSAFGGCGQRCMALSVCILIGDNPEFISKLKEKTSKINIIEEMGPLISEESIKRINTAIDSSVGNGSSILLDRRLEVPEEGSYLGPVIILTSPASEVYKQELFGPVLALINVDNLEQAINIINKNEYGNGTCIYTNSLDESIKFQDNVDVGQIGINVPIPVPPPYFSWSSSKESFLGNNYIYGPQSIDFYTKTKTIMTRGVNVSKSELAMPTN